jgi:hypothetical protein
VSSIALCGTSATSSGVTMFMDGDRPSPRGLGRCAPGSSRLTHPGTAPGRDGS